MPYEFGEYRLDIKRRELWRGCALVELEPQVFDLLAYLVRHHDGIVGKDDLLQAIWRGRTVSDSALTTRINAARRAIGDDGASQRLIRTSRRNGFRFVADVKEAPERATATPLSPIGKPMIAVGPFVSIGQAPDQEGAADGTAEQMLAVLSRVRSLSVLAGGVIPMDKQQTVDVRQAARELGVQYLLEGSVRESRGQLRITAKLVDTETRAQLWADWCDGAVAELFTLQDRIAGAALAAIEPVIETVETNRSMLREESELAPRDFYLRALPGCYGYDLGPLLRARELLDETIERDPGFARALAAAAGCRQFLAVAGWTQDQEKTRLEAVTLAHQALGADGYDPTVLTEAARVLAYFTEDIDGSVALIERALALNPHQAGAWYWNGWIRLFTGQPELALEHFRTASRLRPYHRPCMTGIGAAYLFSGRYSEAADALASASHQLPSWPTTQRFLAAAYVHLGKVEKAREIASRLGSIAPPRLSPAPNSSGTAVFRNREHAEIYEDGLRVAAGAA